MSSWQEGPGKKNTSFFGDGDAAGHGQAGEKGVADDPFSKILETLEEREEKLGADPDKLTAMSNMGILLYNKGDYEGAEPLLRQVLETRETILGPDNPDTIESVYNLAKLVNEKGDYAGAEPLFRRAIIGYERLIEAGKVDLEKILDTLAWANNLALALADKGDYVRAVSLTRLVTKIRQRLQPGDYETMMSIGNLALFLYLKGDYKEADPLFRQSLDGLSKIYARTKQHQQSLRNVINNYTLCLRKLVRPWKIASVLLDILEPHGVNYFNIMKQKKGENECTTAFKLDHRL